MIFIIGGAHQGKNIYAKTYGEQGYELITSYHEVIKKQMEQGLDPLREAEALLSERADKKVVIISNEVGYGLVPMDAFLRQYREQVGRVHCYLAKEAEQVIRVVCGIGMELK